MKKQTLIEIDGVYYPTEIEMTQEEIEEIERQEQERETQEAQAFWAMPYAERVSKLIRERYSLDDELALSRQRETKQEEFEEYFTYCEECKIRARGDE